VLGHELEPLADARLGVVEDLAANCAVGVK
jgi:hypothetical protein